VTMSTATDRVQRFRTEVLPHLDGTVFLPGDPGYDEERGGFNLSVEWRPEAIVGATGPADVLATVRFAGLHGLPVGVMATGHTAAVPADGAVLISTKRMQGLHIDPARGTARVEAGVRWNRVIREAAVYGLAPLNGSSPIVGAVGYTLGGGIGPMARAYGFAADRVHSLDVVTADGAISTVTPEREPDLYWGLVGGKGNLGVVTSMEFELVAESRFYGGGLFFPGDSAEVVLRAYRHWVATVPEEMTSSLALLRLPPIPTVPEPLRGKFVVHVRIAYLGSETDGDRLLRPLRDSAELLVDTVDELPYTAIGTVHDDPVDPLPAFERATFLRSFDEGTITALMKLAGPGTDSPLLLVELRHLGGALGRPNGPPNAVGNRGAAFLLLGVGVPSPDTPAAIVIGQLDLLIEQLGPWSTGKTYLNFLGALDTAPERVREAFDEADYARLVDLKTTYDPTNMFRLTHNIPPLPA
jgi:FAD/FMN-containing dehydrogenase